VWIFWFFFFWGGGSNGYHESVLAILAELVRVILMKHPVTIGCLEVFLQTELKGGSFEERMLFQSVYFNIMHIITIIIIIIIIIFMAVVIAATITTHMACIIAISLFIQLDIVQY